MIKYSKDFFSIMRGSLDVHITKYSKLRATTLMYLLALQSSFITETVSTFFCKALPRVMLLGLHIYFKTSIPVLTAGTFWFHVIYFMCMHECAWRPVLKYVTKLNGFKNINSDSVSCTHFGFLQQRKNCEVLFVWIFNVLSFKNFISSLMKTPEQY